VFDVLNYGVSYIKIILFLLKQDNQHYYDIMVQEAHVSTANLSFLSVSVRSLAVSFLLSERNIKSMFLYIDIMEFTCFSEEIYVSMVSGNDDFFLVFLHPLHYNPTRYKLEYVANNMETH
jgi:hypothetical protein